VAIESQLFEVGVPFYMPNNFQGLNGFSRLQEQLKVRQSDHGKFVLSFCNGIRHQPYFVTSASLDDSWCNGLDACEFLHQEFFQFESIERAVDALIPISRKFNVAKFTIHRIDVDSINSRVLLTPQGDFEITEDSFDDAN
jgi:hypothetical protein